MLVVGEQGVQPCPLFLGEQVGAGVQGPPGGEQWITAAAAMAVQFLLDALAALVEGFAGQTHDVERVHHGNRVGELFGGSGFEAGEPVHRDDLHPVAPRLRPAGQVANTCFVRPSTMSNNLAGPVPAWTVVRSMITVTYLSPRPGVPPHVLVHADDVTPSNRAGSLISTRRPSSSTAVFAVFHDTASPSATLAMLRC